MSIVARGRKWLESGVARLWNTLLPGSCVLCHGACDTGMVCPPCQADLPRLGANACPHCAEPNTGGLPCGHCQSHPPHFDAAWAGWRYEHPMDRLIQAFKYQGQLGLAPLFAEALGRQIAPTAETLDGVIALPLHPTRMAQRGFNQSLEIAKILGRRLNLPLLDCCQRQRPTVSQAELPLTKRQHNVRHAFHCTADLSGRRLLLVDDVLTTGATLSECARTLKLHGASRVEVAVVARTIHH